MKISAYRPHERVQSTGELMDPKTGEIIKPPSRTKQSFRDECDINNILKQYRVSGMLRHVSAKADQGAYQDLPDDMDYQTSINTVMRAQEAFATLPSKIRNQFENDPAKFLTFMADPANEAEVVKMGLATPRKLTESEPAPVTMDALDINPPAAQPSPKANPPPK